MSGTDISSFVASSFHLNQQLNLADDGKGVKSGDELNGKTVQSVSGNVATLEDGSEVKVPQGEGYAVPTDSTGTSTPDGHTATSFS